MLQNTDSGIWKDQVSSWNGKGSDVGNTLPTPTRNRTAAWTATLLQVSASRGVLANVQLGWLSPASLQWYQRVRAHNPIGWYPVSRKRFCLAKYPGMSCGLPGSSSIGLGTLSQCVRTKVWVFTQTGHSLLKEWPPPARNYPGWWEKGPHLPSCCWMDCVYYQREDTQKMWRASVV